MVTLEQMLRLKTQLKAYLEHQEMSASQLSRKSGVSKQTISDWLNGGQPRKLEQLRKVAEILGATIDDLCFGHGPAKGPEVKHGEPIDLLLGDEWVTGVFEIKVRRVRK